MTSLDTADIAGTAPAAIAADDVLAAAVGIARSAAAEVAGAPVDGAHLGVRGVAAAEAGDAAKADDAASGIVAVHAFAATVPGYTGWHWAVSVARAADTDHVTVDEVVLLPGDGALLAPDWVPWDERVRPGDLGPGDLLPTRADDPRLVPAYASDDDENAGDDGEQSVVAFALALGRERVMSRDGRSDAADRWRSGDRGPGAAMARSAPAHCGTCGYLLALAGSLRSGFGVCGNEVTDTDGQVVSVEYGCGAHSQVTVENPPLAEAGELVYDDGDDIEARPTSDGPAETAVAGHDGPPESTEGGAGEAGPEPDAVVVAAEPAPEGQ